jgi:hypothetical protein
LNAASASTACASHDNGVDLFQKLMQFAKYRRMLARPDHNMRLQKADATDCHDDRAWPVRFAFLTLVKELQSRSAPREWRFTLAMARAACSGGLKGQIRRGGDAPDLRSLRSGYCALAVPGKAKTVSVPPSDV